MAKFVFFTGGVVSSLGKGIAAASLAAILQARGYKVRLRKLDPYLNVDPGTMSPSQHGEVFVTDDGAETDLDLGHYERFTGVTTSRADSITSGRIYAEVIARERSGGYLGQTVQVIPHITDAIKAAIFAGTERDDFVLIEIGGTVGDIEGLPFLEAIRQIGNEIGRKNTLFIHLTLIPYIGAAGEVKTKPTQHSVKELLGIGIQPDILLCRCDRPLSDGDRRKIALFCNVRSERVIPALDSDNIYRVPIMYHQEGLDSEVLRHFDMSTYGRVDLSGWHDIAGILAAPRKSVDIAIVGKYTSVQDSYKSLFEAMDHAGLALGVRVNKNFIDSEAINQASLEELLGTSGGILVPGGFGARGTDGKLEAIRFARERSVPFLGICFGMQMAVIEAARSLCGIHNASSTEFGECQDPVITTMSEWSDRDGVKRLKPENGLGGTMRLGSYPAILVDDSRARMIYGADNIRERHRHRFEVNTSYRDRLESAGLKFSGMCPDGLLTEIVERADHPFFMGVQFHPELKSRPLSPHPLFVEFVRSSMR